MDKLLNKLKPNTIIKGNLFPENVHVILTEPFGNSIKLIEEGDSGQIYKMVIPKEIDFLTFVQDKSLLSRVAPGAVKNKWHRSNYRHIFVSAVK